jgi:hypothetical protein
MLETAAVKLDHVSRKRSSILWGNNIVAGSGSQSALREFFNEEF